MMSEGPTELCDDAYDSEAVEARAALGYGPTATQARSSAATRRFRSGVSGQFMRFVWMRDRCEAIVATDDALATSFTIAGPYESYSSSGAPKMPLVSSGSHEYQSTALTRPSNVCGS